MQIWLCFPLQFCEYRFWIISSLVVILCGRQKNITQGRKTKWASTRTVKTNFTFTLELHLKTDVLLSVSYSLYKPTFPLAKQYHFLHLGTRLSGLCCLKIDKTSFKLELRFLFLLSQIQLVHFTPVLSKIFSLIKHMQLCLNMETLLILLKSIRICY